MTRRHPHTLRVPLLLPHAPRLFPSLALLMGSIFAAAALFLGMPGWYTVMDHSLPPFFRVVLGPDQANSPPTLPAAAIAAGPKVASVIRTRLLGRLRALDRLALRRSNHWQRQGAGVQLHAFTIDADGNIANHDESVSTTLSQTLGSGEKAPKLVGLQITYAQHAHPLLAPMQTHRTCGVHFLVEQPLDRNPNHQVGTGFPSKIDLRQLAAELRRDWQRYPQHAPPEWVRRHLTESFALGGHDLGRHIFWPGVAWNLALLAALAALLVSPLRLARALALRRSQNRLAKGLCPACAYPAAGAATCPECGYSYARSCA